MSFKRYMIVSAAVASLCLACLATFNILVDPHDSFRSVALPQLAPYRNISANRFAKANRVKGRHWDVLILGSSREETGFDPLSPPLSELGQVYNAGLPAGNMYEARKVFDFVVERHPPQMIVLGLSLLMFGSTRTGIDDFDQSLFNGSHRTAQDEVDDILRRSLGFRTTLRSLEVVRAARQGDTTEARQVGHRPTFGPVDHPRKMAEELLMFYMSSPDAYVNWQLSQDRIEDFRHVVHESLDRGIRLIVLFPPAHAIQWLAVDMMGQSDSLDNLKRELTKIVDEESARYSNGSDLVQIWDFSSFTGAAAEPFPSLDDQNARMHGYIEQSHFRPVIGKATLLHVFGSENLADELSRLEITGPLTGTRLNSSNIESHLSTLQASKEEYMISQPAEIKWLNSVFWKSRRRDLIGQ